MLLSALTAASRWHLQNRSKNRLLGPTNNFGGTRSHCR